MKRHLTLLFSAGALLSAAGCATVIPPRELVEAREEYAVASSTQVAEASPVELREAARALDRAEREFSKHPRSKKVQDLAYIAKRKAQIAESLARTEQLRGTKARAQAELQSRLGGQYALTEAERLRARLAEEQRLRQEREAELLRGQAEASERAARLEAERLAREQQTESERRAQAQLEQERRAREELESQRRASEAQAQAREEESRRRQQQALARAEEADRKAQQALDALKREAEVREEARGTVITLRGSLLFASGQAELLASAREQLDEVANALKQVPGQQLRIEGHTDARGSAALNSDLSYRRAEAVRAYLESRGVEPERIALVGYGASRPIADNATAEGRATKRRVEIVLKRPPTGVGGAGR